MSRTHRKPGIVRVLCTRPFHQGTDEWARFGHHHVTNLRMVEIRGRARLIWPGAAQRTRTVDVTVPTSDGGRHVLFSHRTTVGAPMKFWRVIGEERFWMFRFRCPCGLDVQRPESELLEYAQRYAAERPGERIPLDIVSVAS